MSPAVICQQWEESERGWGVRPDGYTLHLTMEDCTRFRQLFWKEHGGLPEVPDEYTRECGEPFPLDVNEKTYRRIMAAAKKEAPTEQGHYGIWGEGTVAPSNAGGRNAA